MENRVIHKQLINIMNKLYTLQSTVPLEKAFYKNMQLICEYAARTVQKLA